MDQTALDAWVDAHLLANAPDLSGVVATARGGEVVAHRLFGYANRADGLPTTLDTRFQSASGSKVFTAVAICQLAEAGRLSLDTSVREFGPLRESPLDGRITIRHLLTHTSGLASYYDEDDDGALWAELPMYTMRRPHDFLPMFVDKPSVFAPGERFEYNDAGFVLLGVVVEEITGRPFAEHVREAVFEPAGMFDSGYFESDRLPGRTALSYLDDGRTNVFAVPVVGGGDGGAHVTVPDFGRFWSVLAGDGKGRLLGPEMTAQMLRPATATDMDEPHTHYGLGVWLAGDDYMFVEGGDPGVAMVSEYFPADDLSVTVIANIEVPLWKAFRALPAARRR